MEAEVVRVRSFNRLVTERVGALDDSYLARGRPLGQARLLWEIGSEGTEVRRLRVRLGLDSGYLSRLLRSLEAAGLAVVGPSRADGRVRVVRLTAAGLAERELLDRRSDELARGFLAPLGPAARERLVAAMGEVERLLTAGLVEIEEADPASPDAGFCLESYFAELAGRFEGGFDHALSIVGRDDLRPPAGLFLVARLRGEPVACGGLVFYGPEVADVKRMWVAGSVRGLGLGRRLLGELEQRAAETGMRTLRLETNRALTQAISLYRSSGYREVEPFNDEPYADHWFEKRLGATRGS